MEESHERRAAAPTSPRTSRKAATTVAAVVVVAALLVCAFLFANRAQTAAINGGARDGLGGRVHHKRPVLPPSPPAFTVHTMGELRDTRGVCGEGG